VCGCSALKSPEHWRRAIATMRSALEIAHGWGRSGTADGESGRNGGSEGDRELRAIRVRFHVGVAVNFGGDQEKIGLAGD